MRIIDTKEGFIMIDDIITEFNCDFCDNTAKYRFYYVNKKKYYRNLYWLCEKCLEEKIKEEA
jgi:hypothetical protein